MSLEPNYEKVVSSYRRRIGEMQSQIECKLPVVEEAQINKIICANVRVNILNSNIVKNSVAFDGVANVQVIYSTVDKEINSVDYTLEFKDKYVHAEEINAVDLLISADVIDVRTVLDNGSIKVMAIINIMIDGVCQDVINVLASASGEGVYAKYEDINYLKYEGLASERFETQNSIEIVDAVSSILTVAFKPYIDRVEPNENFVKLFGGVVVNVAYLTKEEVPMLRSYETNFDFVQELALSGTTTDSVVNGILTCGEQNINITTSIDTDKAVLELTVPLDYKGYVWNECVLQMVSDIYSTANELTLNTESFTVSKACQPMTFAERISGTASIEDNALLIDDILGNNCTNIVIANTQIVDDKLVLEGVGTTSVIYRNNETGQIASVDVQIPFSLDVKVSNILAGSDVYASIQITKMQIKARRGTDLEINADVLIHVCATNTSKEAVISSISVQDEKYLDDCNLYIYVAKEGDTFWDIAKQMSMSEEEVLAQNPNIVLPIEAGARLVVYRQTCAKM